MSIVITGFADSDKVPGFVGETKFGASKINIGSIALKLLCVGLKTSAGSATADSDVLEIFSGDDADARFGKGSQLARMLRRAIKQNRGYRLYGAAVTETGTAATVVITIANAATSAGTIRFWVGGDAMDVSISSGRSAVNIAADIHAEFQKHPEFCCSSGVVGAVVTLTIRNLGVQGNQYILAQDLSNGPASVTSTLSGSGAAVNTNMRFFGGGAGQESYTTLLSVLNPAWFNRVALGSDDAASAAAWEVQTDAKAGPLEGRMEHVVVGFNGTLANAIVLAQTTLNNHRFQVCWLENSECHPSEIAAAMASERAATEQAAPNSGYDNVTLQLLGQRLFGDKPLRTELQSALDSGVTPLTTDNEGNVVVVRAVTTRSLDGSTPDYRTLDVSEAVVPDYVRYRLAVGWTSEFVKVNKHVAPDPREGEPDRPAGVATPSLWSGYVNAELANMERELILTQTAENPAQSEYNYAANRIMSAVPCVPLPIQHQIGVSVRQFNVSA